MLSAGGEFSSPRGEFPSHCIIARVLGIGRSPPATKPTRLLGRRAHRRRAQRRPARSAAGRPSRARMGEQRGEHVNSVSVLTLCRQGVVGQFE